MPQCSEIVLKQDLNVEKQGLNVEKILTRNLVRQIRKQKFLMSRVKSQSRIYVLEFALRQNNELKPKMFKTRINLLQCKSEHFRL